MVNVGQIFSEVENSSDEEGFCSWRIPVWNSGIWSSVTLPWLIGGTVKIGFFPHSCTRFPRWLGWGYKRSANIADLYARLSGGRLVRVEDGFLRSYNIGEQSPPLSIVLDRSGIYYDCSRPSDLEKILNTSTGLAPKLGGDVQRAQHLILRNRLSKYNNAPLLGKIDLCGRGGDRVLVVDQTIGDLSVVHGAANAGTFHTMLRVAIAENPSATIYIKTHPEVSSGRKRGYLTGVRDNARVVVLRDSVNPLSLIELMNHVYVVTSTMGFEALLAGKPVTCFGIPWYAGWGVTDDRQHCPRRVRRRTVDELFAAAYFHYSRYLNPVTRQRGTIFDVIDWLIQQRRMAFPQDV